EFLQPEPCFLAGVAKLLMRGEDHENLHRASPSLVVFQMWMSTEMYVMLNSSCEEEDYGTHLSPLSLLSERAGQQAGQDHRRETTLSVPQPRLCPSVLLGGPSLQGALA